MPIKKRGQIPSTIFIYISAAVILILLVWFGFSVIGSMSEKHALATMLEFKSGLQQDINKMTSRYGSSSLGEYPMPSGFEEICFVDLKHVDSADIDKYPVIKDSVESGAKVNLFFLGKNNFETQYVEDMELLYPPYFDCIPTGADTIELKIIGTDMGAAVKTPPRERYCKNAENNNLCDGLNIFFFPGYGSDCCSLYGFCC